METEEEMRKVLEERLKTVSTIRKLTSKYLDTKLESDHNWDMTFKKQYTYLQRLGILFSIFLCFMLIRQIYFKESASAIMYFCALLNMGTVLLLTTGNLKRIKKSEDFRNGIMAKYNEKVKSTDNSYLSESD